MLPSARPNRASPSSFTEQRWTLWRSFRLDPNPFQGETLNERDFSSTKMSLPAVCLPAARENKSAQASSGDLGFHSENDLNSMDSRGTGQSLAQYRTQGLQKFSPGFLCPLSVCLSLSLTLSLTPSFSLSPSLSLSHTRTQHLLLPTHTHTRPPPPLQPPDSHRTRNSITAALRTCWTPNDPSSPAISALRERRHQICMTLRCPCGPVHSGCVTRHVASRRDTCQHTASRSVHAGNTRTASQRQVYVENVTSCVSTQRLSSDKTTQNLSGIFCEPKPESTHTYPEAKPVQSPCMDTMFDATTVKWAGHSARKSLCAFTST